MKTLLLLLCASFVLTQCQNPFSKKQRDNHAYYEQQNFSSDWKKNGEVTLYKYNSREREYATWGRYDLYKKVNNGNPVYKVIYYGEDLIIYRNQSYNPTSSRFCDQCKYIAGEYYIKDLWYLHLYVLFLTKNLRVDGAFLLQSLSLVFYG